MRLTGIQRGPKTTDPVEAPASFDHDVSRLAVMTGSLARLMLRAHGHSYFD